MKRQGGGATKETLVRSSKLKYALVGEGLLTGLLAGALSIVYRLILEQAELLAAAIRGEARSSWLVGAAWFAALIVMALIVSRLLKWEPMISGSGIPQVKGEISGYIKQNWLKVIVGKIVGGALCIFGGLSLGREGPSIQIGAMAGKGVSRGLKRIRTEENYLTTCGASAGLAAAFNAPLAGIMFALEGLHKTFSAPLMFSVIIACVAGDFLSKCVFGLNTVFSFTAASAMPLELYPLIFVLGALTGAVGALYNKSTTIAQDLFDKVKRPWLKTAMPFVAAGALAFILPEALGSGRSMISLLATNPALMSVAVLLTVKFAFSIFCFGSGAPGGIFFPLLVLGAYMGDAFGSLPSSAFNVDPVLINDFIILGMAGFFTAVVRAPITGIILIFEMTGTLSHFLALTCVSLAAYAVADLLKSPPIYDTLLDRIVKKLGVPQKPEKTAKVLVEIVVNSGSYLEGKSLSEVSLPEACLFVAVKRAGKEIIPRGDTVMLTGDTIVALVDEEDEASVGERLREANDVNLNRTMKGEEK